VEIGFGNAIKFDHDFVGRAALEKEIAKPKRLMVTLIWNPEDVLDVLRSQFEDEVPYQHMELVEDLSIVNGSLEDHADQVLVHGKLVGVSSGRMFSPKYRKMISIASIDTQLKAPGTEVTVLWGDPGRRQKKIRCIVAEYPIISENRNEKRGVEDIPHPKK
jgi:glycine cleavage system aminomethyltransferase T